MDHKNKASYALSRSVMEKKFKINDGSSKYVEQATLLEPAHTSASTQNELEEIREVSFQLSQIKKKHDEAKKMANMKEEELQQVRKEIEQIKIQGAVAEGPAYEMKTKLEMLNESLDETKYKIEEENFTKSSYVHILERMKRDFIAAKIRSSENSDSLKNTSQVLDMEKQKQRKIKEEKL